ncbi:hypothetical protein PRUB_a2388 [Pseudoalteromonas rubra]|uniref:Uncharacterized protein n=1 Tax=Pseudoalteromonas rubra TaxID=43658 RepID=A0A8T0CD01_9GAMM|nr:hypothetical protein PRUB_a2388 [Pseudoalteromonas rubra]
MAVPYSVADKQAAMAMMLISREALATTSAPIRYEVLLSRVRIVLDE